MKYQIVISGVGGQGVLFVTRLLAEAAMLRGLPVFTSETHGMAQRGGTVLSHLKVGPFSSPLIQPGCADGLILLKSENRVQHGAFLTASGWLVVNAPEIKNGAAAVDADRLALTLNNPKAVNLIVLGYALNIIPDFFCNGEDIKTLLEARLADRPDLRSASLEALETGERQAEVVRHKKGGL